MQKRNYKKAFGIYTLIFAVVFIVSYFGYFKSGMTLVTKMDGVNQFYQGFLYCGQYIKHFMKNILAGSPSLPLYDLNVGMGEDIIGVLSYYGIGDPLYFIAVFADNINGPYLFSATYFLRLFLAGAAFLYYERELNIDSRVAPLGAMCMVVNGYTFGGVSSYMGWGSVLYYMPLVLVGVERVLKGKNGWALITFGTFYGGICDFYHLYMLCVFLVPYCIGRTLSLYGRNIKRMLSYSLKAAGFVLLGIGLSGPLFFPECMGFTGSERAIEISITDIIFNIQNYIPHWAVYKAFAGINERFYFKYVSKVTIAEYLALIAAYFMPKSNRRLQVIIANTVTLLTVAMPITGYIFSAFGESGFIVNIRWVFLMHFLFAVTLVYVLSELLEILSAKKGVRAFGIMLGAAYIAVIVNTGYFVYVNGHIENSRLDMENVTRNVDSPVVYSEQVMNDKALFRVSCDRFLTTADRPENAAMLKGYHGITYWFSIMNNYTQNFVNEVTNTNEDWRSDGFFHDPVYETITGVKYYFSKGVNDIPDSYQKLTEFEYYGENWAVYENPDYFGMSYLRDEKLSAAAWENKNEYREYFENMVNTAKTSDGIISEEYDNSKNIYKAQVRAKAGEELIVSIPYLKGWRAYVDGQPANIMVKDMMFMSVSLEAGEHEVELRYHNNGFRLGLVTMAMSFLIIIIYLNWRRRSPIAEGFKGD